MGKGLIWFRNDLRLHDNEALHRAILTKNELLPVYIKQRKISRGLPFLEREESSYKRLFLEESLFELNNSFNKIGGDLLIKEGNALDLIPKLCLKYSIDEVFASFEYANDELKEQEELGQSLGFLGIKLRLFHTGSLIHPDDLPFAIDQLPDIFTVFRKKVESLAVVRPSFADVTKAEFVAHSEPSYIFQFEGVKSPYTGGELAGLVRVDYYIHQNQLINEYKQTRNGLLGLDYSSKFSPWLALGCLSPRTVFHEISSYEEKVLENDSTYWLKFELLWREYFRYVMMKFGKQLFTIGGLKSSTKRAEIDIKRFDSWCKGETGQEFIDANMKELNATGYMSNRGRQNVASFLVHDLGVDWRMGASYFEKMLVDYDVYSNWGNWAYVAGVGNDPRENRKFNPERQAGMYDPNKEFINYWANKSC